MDTLDSLFYKNHHTLSPTTSVTLSPLKPNGNYSDNVLSKRPVLYLDFDGVINFFGSRNSYQKNSSLGYMKRNAVNVDLGGSTMNTFPLNYSAELLRKLNDLDVDVLWLTTWRDHTELLEKAMDWHKPTGTLYWGEDGAYSTNNLYGDSSGKLAAIVNDQTFNARPFLWADDTAVRHYWDNEGYQSFLSNNSPHMTLEPNDSTGLTLNCYLDMKNFVDSLKEFNDDRGNDA